MNSHKHTIIFRCDGSSTIGLGHLVRCFALAQMLQDNYDITFVCLNIPEAIQNDITNSKFRLIKISNESDFFALIDEHHIVVLDGYHFTSEFQKDIKNTGATLICIDDMHNLFYRADLIINHSPIVSEKDYKTLVNTKFALGIEYALLRISFLNQANLKRTEYQTKSVVLCFGGADPENLTIKTLEVLFDCTDLERINVITGSSYLHNEEINEYVLKDKRIHHFKSISEQSMLQILVESEFAIVPASGVLLEAIAAGCKIIYGYYAENQKETSDYLKKKYPESMSIGYMPNSLKTIPDCFTSNFSFDELRIAIANSKENINKAFRCL
jgi:UDP-2,4-diacetamido-2,4,6-trideoxy-beta-L-altropyranose hydrolase